VSADENKRRLLAEMDVLMRSLRQCDTQATAVAWMTRAYNAMDGATRLVADLERMIREEASQQRGMIFQVVKPKLEIVQSIPKHFVHSSAVGKTPNYHRPTGETVVYPEFFMHPGLKPAPRAWTREDTRRLELAAKMGPRRIVRKGQ
jgi:hypothetical protein